VIGPTMAQAICERLLGAAPERLEPFHPKTGGDDSHAFRLWSGREAMLLKVKKHAGSPVGVYFHGRLREAGLPVPELIAFDPKAGPNQQACAIWEWVEGRPAEWGPTESCPYDEAQLGELLHRIHELRFDGSFGFLGDDPPARCFSSHPGLGPVSDTWAGFFGCEWAARRYRDAGYLDSTEASLLASLPGRLGGKLNEAEPRLLHMGDIMHHGNVLVDSRGRIAAIVDYVESTAGAPRWALAWFDYYFTPSAREPVAPFDLARFRAAYGTDHDPGDMVGRFYLVAVLVFEKLLFCDPGSPRGQWAIRTLKDNVQVIGGRR
jgi:hypothetical protein